MAIIYPTPHHPPRATRSQPPCPISAAVLYLSVTGDASILPADADAPRAPPCALRPPLPTSTPGSERLSISRVSAIAVPARPHRQHRVPAVSTPSAVFQALVLRFNELQTIGDFLVANTYIGT
ncbi:hypothetical protein ZWY2020_055236 [Hordeum vulgare]|nr:hypothetical protein ZWY2020_055236 [Hordeum vulgare]